MRDKIQIEKLNYMSLDYIKKELEFNKKNTLNTCI